MVPGQTSRLIGGRPTRRCIASGQGGLVRTSPIGVAVVARWPGGGDRVPARGWITVPPPPTQS